MGKPEDQPQLPPETNDKAIMLNSDQLIFLEGQLSHYHDDHDSVSNDWQGFLADFDDTDVNCQKPSWARVPVAAYQDNFDEISQASVNQAQTTVASMSMPSEPVAPVVNAPQENSNAHAEVATYKFMRLVEGYRQRGHMMARLDPLGLEVVATPESQSLTLASVDLTQAELALTLTDSAGPFAGNKISDMVKRLETIYSHNIGVEFCHITRNDEREWLNENFESAEFWQDFSATERREFFQHLREAEQFEQFLHKKFRGDKRFSIEGGESSILALELILEHSAAGGVNEVVIGMAHRGRLNTLTKIMGKPYSAVLSEFKGMKPFPDEIAASGDVKYHAGFSNDREIKGRSVHLSLMCNPSHLETVNPVVMGKVRSVQDITGDHQREYVMGMLIHGDAAFAGQGVVAESLELSELDGYEIGGVMHLIINNQVGFTADVHKARKSRYPTELAKVIQAPIFHVNGDNPDDVARVVKLASAYRAKYRRDVVINLVCFRKYGHNEGDEPNFTQPLMYQKIAKQPSVTENYGKLLEEQQVLSSTARSEIEQKFAAKLDAALEGGSSQPKEADWLKGRWSGCEQPENDLEHPTGVDMNKLKDLGSKLAAVPAEFKIHPKIAKLLKAKLQMLETGQKIDWAMGEALAFATIVADGKKVRLSGQDAGRGTFSHRHSVWRDQVTGDEHIPLNHVCQPQGHFEVIDSPLSEYAVLGYEYGYAMAHPHQLNIWEAQFGDFANGAQIIIDQYITAAEAKWLRYNGIVMLLPHGMEGMGPEHSSARLERFLQLCAEQNIQVAYPTTPASIFHLLRRQVVRKHRRPLVVMSPKSLLRHPKAQSELNEFAANTTFRPVLPDTIDVDDEEVKYVVLCTGKIYYDLAVKRDQHEVKDRVIVRLEQLYPFPKYELLNELKRYPNAQIIWCQEEPQNMGACLFVASRINRIIDQLELKKKHIIYAGRRESASPATGYKSVHEQEQNELLCKALGIKLT